MAFDVKAFLETHFIPREAEIPITEPELKKFFSSNGKPDVKPIWKVRGLSGPEMGRANAAAEKSDNIKGIIKGLLSRMTDEQADAIKKMMGQTDDLPSDIVKRLEQLMIGSLEPKCDHRLAVRLCDTFPIEFYEITNKILELTGLGHLPGKPRPSGKTPKSSS